MEKKLSLGLSILILLFVHVFGYSQTASTSKGKYELADSLRYTNYIESLKLLDETYHEFLNQKDTINAINSLGKMAEINGHHGRYKVSYDHIWEALALATGLHNKAVIAELYLHLGRYYGFYKRKDEAYQYLEKSLSINKGLVAEKGEPSEILVKNYYEFCVLNRELLDFKEAKIFLDSCYMHFNRNGLGIRKEALQFEEAVILSNTGNVNKAIQIFEEIKEIFAKNLPSYNVLVETYLGLAYQEKGQLDLAENSFKSALETSEKYDSHRDFSILIHEYLSNIYFMKGDFPQAYKQLKITKDLDFTYFDSRSENNRPLLEIQDQFRKEQEKAERIRQKQKLDELKAAEKIFFLQRTLLIIAILSFVSFGYLYFQYLRNKHKIERQLIKKNQELEIKKANELIEIKNKEMAVSTLKLIEKEETIEDFKETLEKSNWDLDSSKLKSAVKSLKVNHTKNWEEFETRFISVNSNFYKNLHKDFPNLTSGDDKLCALIKLNLSSKDMAKLMGISIESVHTSRYRLRKKLGLDRDDNLTDFMAQF